MNTSTTLVGAQGLTENHLEYLEEAGFSREWLTGEAKGLCYSVNSETIHDIAGDPFHYIEDGNGIVFNWVSASGQVTPQFRPDNPSVDESGRAKKYLFPKGSDARYSLLRKGDKGKTPIYLVEGTKQGLAVLQATHKWEGRIANLDPTVVAIPGCWGWQTGSQSRELPMEIRSMVLGREVHVILDADAATNPQVYDAGTALKEALGTVGKKGVASIDFLQVPGGGTQGIDDVLAPLDTAQRRNTLQVLLAGALQDPARKRPAAELTSHTSLPLLRPTGGVIGINCALEILQRVPAALMADETIAFYQGGTYVPDYKGYKLTEHLYSLISESVSTHAVSETSAMVRSILNSEDRRIKDGDPRPYLNFKNGLLNLETGDLLPHTPDYMDTFQIQYDWDPTATAPTYEQWLHEATLLETGEDQVASLEDTASQILGGRVPERAMFLFGPSRSGKSTFLNILAAITGETYTSSVPLHDLEDNRFKTARLVGKRLNVAGDLPAHYIPDLAVLKGLTGNDPMEAEQKGKDAFTFRNRAVLAFSANTVPTFGESSKAIFIRMVPGWFPHSAAGREDAMLEDRLHAEIPGVIVRWVRAWQARQQRDYRYLEAPAEVQALFEKSASATRQFADDCLEIHEDMTDEAVWASPSTVYPDYGMTITEVFDLYTQWCEAEGRGRMKRSRFATELAEISGILQVRDTNRRRIFNISPKDQDEMDLGSAQTVPGLMVPDFQAIVAEQAEIASQRLSEPLKGSLASRVFSEVPEALQGLLNEAVINTMVEGSMRLSPNAGIETVDSAWGQSQKPTHTLTELGELVPEETSQLRVILRNAQDILDGQGLYIRERRIPRDTCNTTNYLGEYGVSDPALRPADTAYTIFTTQE